MDLQAALARIEELETQVSELQRVNGAKINPVYAELLAHLVEGPLSISELAERMTRENRAVSQWLHALKSKHGADIITLADGRKQLVNVEEFRGK